MTLALTGHGVTRGIAIGRCHLVERNELEIGEYRIGPDETEREIQRFHHAVEAAQRQLEALAGRVIESVGIGHRRFGCGFLCHLRYRFAAPHRDVLL